MQMRILFVWVYKHEKVENVGMFSNVLPITSISSTKHIITIPKNQLKWDNNAYDRICMPISSSIFSFECLCFSWKIFRTFHGVLKDLERSGSRWTISRMTKLTKSMEWKYFGQIDYMNEYIDVRGNLGIWPTIKMLLCWLLVWFV